MDESDKTDESKTSIPTHKEISDTVTGRPCEEFYCRFDLWAVVICVIGIFLILSCWLIFNVRRQIQAAALFRDLVILTRDPDHPLVLETAAKSLLEKFEDKDHRGVAMQELREKLLPSDVIQDAMKTLRIPKAGD